MKKAAKQVHAASGILGKKVMLPLTGKDVAGAILEQRCALTCLKATVPTVTPTETEISTDARATISTDVTTSSAIQYMERNTECSENAITNTGKTPIAVKNAVFILSSDTI
jgi:lipopolysaccharide export system protein LptC